MQNASRPERPPAAGRFERLPSTTATFTLHINGRPHPVDAGWSVATALIAHGYAHCRRDAAGRPRGPFCLTGACFECLAEIDGIPNRQACQTPVADGMRVVIDGTESPG